MGAQETKSLTLCLLTIYASITVRRVATKDYKLGVLLPYCNDVWEPLPSRAMSPKYYAAAVSIAVDKVNNDPKLLPGSKLSFVWNNTHCNQTKMVQIQHWQIKQGVSGFIGPVCHLRKAAKVARKHGLPVISFGGQDPHVSNKKLYPNVARTNPSSYKAVLKISALLKAKFWKRVSIIYEDQRTWRAVKKHLVRHLTKEGIAISRQIKVEADYLKNGSEVAPKAINSASQVTIFLLSFGKIREIMTCLEIRKRLDKKPDYGFVALNLDRDYVDSLVRYPFKWFFSEYRTYSEEVSRMTQRAFKKLLVISVKPDPKGTKGYEAFRTEVKRRSSRKPFYSNAYKGCMGFSNGACLFQRSKLKPPYAAAYLYDAVVQFAKALHETTTAGEELNGERLVNKLKGRHFTGIDGRKHEFDNNADVKYEFTVLGLKKRDNDQLNMLPIETGQ